MNSIDQSPDLGRHNARLFIWFRCLFNCRFYYPVYTIMFLDFGLTMAQFALLNALWAGVIVLLEVPSGALADHLGRRNLVIGSAVLMVLEMTVLLLAPVCGPDATPGQLMLLWWLFVLNRVLSGASEAAASGADEALAYDAFPEAERRRAWPKVLADLTRAMAIGFILATALGALVYDAGLVNRMLGWIGIEAGITPEQSLKFPIWLNLITAIGALLVALRMVECHRGEPGQPAARGLRQALVNTMEAGRWVLRSPAPLVLILLGVLFDSMIRLFYTVAPNYYRLLDIREGWFGVIGAGAALLGMATAGIMERMARRCGAGLNFRVVGLMVGIGLVSMMMPVGWWSLLPLVPLLLSMRFLQYFLSHYLNQVTDSSRRATVLSFKGLSMNLAYGLVTLLFGVQAAVFEGRFRAEGMAETEVVQAAFAESIFWWPAWYALTILAFWAFLRWRMRGTLDQLVTRPG